MKFRHYLVALTIFVLDRLTKWLVQVYLDPVRPVEVIPGYLRFSYTENTGVAFGLFDAMEFPWKPYILSALSIAAIAAILIYSAGKSSARWLLHYGLAVTMGGILGNFLDRLLKGYVIDFIDFHVQEIFHWPAFNVADSFITIGITLLLIDTLWNPEEEKAAVRSPACGKQ